MSPNELKVGGRYNWRSQPEKLVYLGRNWSGNGYWHQFALVNKPNDVWCEVLDSDLPSFEETKRGLVDCGECLNGCPGQCRKSAAMQGSK